MQGRGEEGYVRTTEARKLHLLEAIADALDADYDDRERCPQCSLFVPDVDEHLDVCKNSRGVTRLLNDPEALEEHLAYERPDEDEEDEDAVAAEQFVDRTVDEVTADLDTGEFDEHLDAIRAAEEDGEDRVTVTDALDDREE